MSVNMILLRKCCLELPIVSWPSTDTKDVKTRYTLFRGNTSSTLHQSQQRHW